MARFIGRLQIEPYNKVWKVTSPITYTSIKTGRITIPVGFTTDFASIPRIFYSFIPRMGWRYNYASLLHDYLYSRDCFDLGITRSEADKIFLDAMDLLGVRRWRRVIMYYGVRLFGNRYFRK